MAMTGESERSRAVAAAGICSSYNFHNSRKSYKEDSPHLPEQTPLLSNPLIIKLHAACGGEL